MKIEVLRMKVIRVGYHLRRGSRGLENLKRSMEQQGQLEPITVYADGDKYTIIDGVLRFLAAQQLGWETIVCIVIDADEEKSYHLAYIKNIERQSLNPIEEALHFQTVQKKFGYNVEDLVRKGYGPRSTLDDKLRLLTLPEDIQKKIVEGTDLNPAIGYELGKLPDEKSQRELAEEIIEKGMSSRKVKEKVQSLNARRKPEEKKIPLQVEIPEGEIPGVFFKDSSDMSEIPDESVGLIVTSPGYCVGFEYEKDLHLEEHLKILRAVLHECVRVTVPGGKICINVGDIRNYGTRNGGKPEIELIGHHIQSILREKSVRLVDIITWHKGWNWVSNPQVSYHDKIQHTTYRIRWVEIYSRSLGMAVRFQLEAGGH